MNTQMLKCNLLLNFMELVSHFSHTPLSFNAHTKRCHSCDKGATAQVRRAVPKASGGFLAFHWL